MTSKDTNPKDAIGTAKWRQFMTVPRQVLWEVGVGMLEGALKYGRHNYRGAGVRASVYLDASLGHIEQFIEGEDVDKDSGLSHITKAICSLIVLRDAMMNDFWVDDRPPKIKDLDHLREMLQCLVSENFERYADKDPHHYTQEIDGAPYRMPEIRPETFPDWPPSMLGMPGEAAGDAQSASPVAVSPHWVSDTQTDPDFREAKRLLKDPTWLPGPLRGLGDDDPMNLPVIDENDDGFSTTEIVEGLSWSQLDRLVEHEATCIGLKVKPGAGEQLYDCVLRRVLVRIKDQVPRLYRLDFPTGGTAYRVESRLTPDDWHIAQPGVRITHLHHE